MYSINMFWVFMACLYILYLSDSLLSSQSIRLQKAEGQTCGLSFFLVICSHLIVFHPHFSCYSSRPAASWPLAMSRPARFSTLIFKRCVAAVWKKSAFTVYKNTQQNYKTFYSNENKNWKYNSNINKLHKYINI